MSKIDPSTVDVDNVIARIQAVRRGELPADNVSIEELRAAVEAQRNAFAAGIGAASTRAAPARKTVGKSTLILPGLDDLLG
jgi:hypothetical protein